MTVLIFIRLAGLYVDTAEVKERVMVGRSLPRLAGMGRVADI
jgi:hypothetical protein